MFCFGQNYKKFRKKSLWDEQIILFGRRRKYERWNQAWDPPTVPQTDTRHHLIILILILIGFPLLLSVVCTKQNIRNFLFELNWERKKIKIENDTDSSSPIYCLVIMMMIIVMMIITMMAVMWRSARKLILSLCQMIFGFADWTM